MHRQQYIRNTKLVGKMSFDNHFFISAGSRLRSRSEIELNIFYRDLFLKHEENLKGFETIVLDARNIGVRQDFLFSLAGSIILETDAASVFFEPYSEETYEKLSDQEFVVVTKAKDEDVYFFFRMVMHHRLKRTIILLLDGTTLEFRAI